MSPALTAVLPLSGWENFYVIVGSSAAALTGLTFIVITISVDRAEGTDNPARRLYGLRAFISPTVAHFSVALWISALQSVPAQTALSLALLLGITGVVGTLYCARVIYWMVRTFTESAYKPFLEDWIWNATLPILAYLGLFGAAWLLPGHTLLSLRLIGGIALLLLFIGIHNAWDVVAWMTTERHARKNRHRRVELPRREGEG
jgi:hypothetical protein